MKRFTETTKWGDKWFRGLSRDSKIAFYYMIENCDAGGVWEADYGLADFCIGGEPLDWDGVLTDMGDRVMVLPNGKWYLTKFVEFQYGRLSAECKPHMAVVRVLKTHGISIEYPKGMHTVKFSKGRLTLKDKDKDKDKDRIQGPAGSAELALEQPMPAGLDTPEFRSAWADWLAYRHERRLPKLIPKSIDAQLQKLAGWGQKDALASIKQSIEQQWQGLFEPRAISGKGPGGKRANFA